MAGRVMRAGDERARIDLAFQLAFARAATPVEQSRTAAFLAECNADGTSAELQAWTTLCQALLASAEFRYLN